MKGDIMNNSINSIALRHLNGIYIARENFNSALDGDRVLVKITNEGYDSKGKPGAEGEIIKIIERRKNTVVGILEKNKK